jgi:hypothetical protein
MHSDHISLVRRSNGIYYIAWYEENRQRYRSTGCTVKAHAFRQLRSFDGTIPREQSPVLLSAFGSEFLRFAQSIYSPKTFDIYRRTLRYFSAFVEQNRLLSQITAQHLDSYVASRLPRVKPVTVHIEMRALRSALNKAVA